MIRQIVLGAASAAVLALTVPAAMAADLPAYEPAPAVIAPAAFSWTGPYLGVHAGYGWGNAAKASPDGWMVGGYLGYNYQFDGSPVVIGIETDINYASIDDKRNARGGRTKVSTDWNGATRARIGYAFDRFLVYGAGGLAYADREFKRSPGDKDSKTAVGWTVGGGIEYAASDNVSVRAEYRYTDYGKDTFKLANSRPKSSYDEHRVMVGVAYKFDSPF
ncbi:outer membrane protein [Hansschlegelia sp.]|uniref:outer membrane protein n=1 Tax=Hansschlegelia sp. TaxID=2041892 RepID=UPI002D0E7A06|nr:outer membrane protein [Hansschlegelia sp.]HVI27676.1 outer membrane protein [Hansschlegelia sp.]